MKPKNFKKYNLKNTSDDVTKTGVSCISFLIHDHNNQSDKLRN